MVKFYFKKNDLELPMMVTVKTNIKGFYGSAFHFSYNTMTLHKNLQAKFFFQLV